MTPSSPTVILIDDEPGARAVIREFLKHSFPDLNVIGEAAGIKEGFLLFNQLKPDLVFLDIELEDGTGFELLDKIQHENCKVVFTTGHNDFAIKAFRYNAIDYLLKPIDPDEFTVAVKKAIEHMAMGSQAKQFLQLLDTTKNKSFDRIALTTSDGLVFASTQDITRIETYGNYCFVFMSDGERLLVSRNLKEFEEMLPEPDFFRIHQSHMVNTSFVRKFIKGEGDHVLMTDGSKVPVSRRRKEDFIQVISKNSYG